ncbi:MAG: GNAT family N-acetyltransferase [Bauldia sp.]|nr:GNAT family N-acetyltransferase [Bauldia sp.]
MPPIRAEVRLTMPTLADRAMVHGWMTAPGIVERMMGPPLFPEIPVPTLAEFTSDWERHFWTHERPEAGRMFVIEAAGERVGAIAQNELVTTPSGRRAAEIDLWLSGPAVLGRGFGPAALLALCRVLDGAGVGEVVLQPSARNPAAIRAYAAAGFDPSPLPAADAARHYRTVPDYRDSVFMVRDLTASRSASPP